MSYYIYLRTGIETGSETSRLLYDSGWPDGALSLAEAALTFELDEPAKLTFKMTPDHPFYDAVRPRLDTVDVFEDRKLIFRGSARTVKTDRDRLRTVSCEDCLRWLDDVPDRYSNENALAYMLGTRDKPVTLTFSGDKDRIGHTWTDKDNFGTYEDGDGEKTRANYLKVREFDSVFDVEFDGKTYRVPMEDIYEKQEGVFVRVGYLGAASIFNSDYQNEEGSAGSSAPFYITNEGIWTKPETKDDESGDPAEEAADDAVPDEEEHTVKIVRRDPAPVATMFRRMIDWGNKGNGGYNLVCGLNRRMRSAPCTVEGSLLYDPAQGDSCLDTLRAWQKLLGGYLTVDYIYAPPDDRWYPYIRYEKEPGEDRDDVVFSYGINLTDVTLYENSADIVTAIRGTVETDGVTYTLADDKCPVPALPDEGYALWKDGDYRGYLRRNDLWYRYGRILADKKYTLTDEEEFNPVPRDYAQDKNPLQRGWYELAEFDADCGGYYYRRTEDTRYPAGDEKQYYAKKYDVITPPEGGFDAETNPARNGWYELEEPDPDKDWGRYIYKETPDTSPVDGKTYYEDAVWRRLYARVKADLDAADKEAETATVTAVDPRLVGVGGAAPEKGCNYPVYAAPYGLNGTRYVLTKNEINLADPAKGKLTLGREKDLLSKQIAIIQQGGR